MATGGSHHAVGIHPASTAGESARETAEFAGHRRRMIREQLDCRGRDITNPRVLDAMGRIPRHAFVPPSERAEAYGDYPLPIGHGQTISQPYIVALMTEVLDPQPADRILEIGTGSGYQAAVLSHLVGEVCTVEIIPGLARRAADALRENHCDNVRVRVGDGHEGWPERAPFDGILVTCAAETVPPALMEQLKDGGRLILPVGRRDAGQQLLLVERHGLRWTRTELIPVRFVPMTGVETRQVADGATDAE